MSHRHGAHRRVGVSTPGRIGAGEGDGKAASRGEGDCSGVLYSRRGSHTAEIPGDCKGLVSSRIHTVALYSDRRIEHNGKVCTRRIDDTPGRGGTSTERLGSDQGVDHAKPKPVVDAHRATVHRGDAEGVGNAPVARSRWSASGFEEEGSNGGNVWGSG